MVTVSGLLSGPRDTLQQTLLAQRTPAGQRTEVFGWLNAFMWAGYGLGTTTAGYLTGPTDGGAVAFTAAAITALLSAALVIPLYRSEKEMSVLRITRYTTDPGDTEQVLALRSALVAAVRNAYPGLTQTTLTRTDDETWMDVWRWESRAHADAAIADSSALPETTAAFAITRNATAEFADIVDER